MKMLARLDTYFYYLIAVVALIIVLLLLIRTLINYANVNPFSRWVLTIRRWTDPMVEPVRRVLMQYGVSYKIAPLISILLTLVFGYAAIQFISNLLATIANVSLSLQAGNLLAAAGYLLYGLLAFYGVLLLVRVIFSWGRVYHSNRVLRWIDRATDPVLIPLRRRLPPGGRLDLSPLIAFVIIWILQLIVAATMIRNAPAGW